ncbi:fumarylacetoacetate hydrolase family protein [Radiobacillus sp. PE A8.2]|uniref:fumarylacetoacetate hydrolase family protein n=1 Tax=Radiobacillus sp. PE A8.2 TaxID=3380349 RepID=UPI00388DB1B7
MKLVSYKPRNFNSPYRMGFILEDQVIDLHDAYKQKLVSTDEQDQAAISEQLLPADPDHFYALSHVSLRRAVEAYHYAIKHTDALTTYDRTNLTLGPPVPNPSKIICIGTNYKDHVAEMKSQIPAYPVLFAKFANALIGPEDDIEKSPLTNKLDYEVELAIVIGKKASEVTKESALEYIAGYTIANDVSARDLQKRTPQWLQGKSLDRSTPIGPWIVTTDELTNPAVLTIKSYVNGEIRQNSNTKHLIFDIPYLIEFISNLITLEPGDIILTGTPDGVGFAMDPPGLLEIGDVVTLEIEGIGRLENIVAEKTTK